MKKISIIIADDHPLIRLGMINFLNQNESFNIIGEAEDGTKALELILEKIPDIAILDINMPGMNGIEICEKLVCKNLTTKVLFVTLYNDKNLLQKSKNVGSWGYLLKENSLQEINEAILSVHKGVFYVGKEISQPQNMELLDTKLNDLNKNIDLLTKTEKDILILISKQFTTPEIAEKLFVSEKTIKNHRHNIIQKLGLPHEQNVLLKFALDYVNIINI